MKTPRLTIRTVDFRTDLPDMARLYTFTRPEKVTEEQIRDWWQAEPDEIRLTRVALNEQGRIVGMSDVQSENWMRPSHFWIQAIVDPEWRSLGIGSRLFDSALRFAHHER
jgi:GNAT superfamily N-acetyltransferase